MIATAKFQKSLKRAVGTKPYTLKVREMVRDLAANVGNVQHPLLRRPEGAGRAGRAAMIVITSNRGLAGAYNGSVLRTAQRFLRQREAAGRQVDLYVSGKKGATYFNFQKRPIVQRYDQFGDLPRWADVNQVAQHFIERFTSAQIDSLHIAYMDFISASVQRPQVLTVLPLESVSEALDLLGRQVAEAQASAQGRQVEVSSLVEEEHGEEPALADAERRAAERLAAEQARRSAAQREAERIRQAQSEMHHYHIEVPYEFSPTPAALLDLLLPLTVKTAIFQCFLDAMTSENVARMVAMKSATDNADKMVKSLTMRYNRARQSQITTELSEIMGGVEAMKA